MGVFQFIGHYYLYQPVVARPTSCKRLGTPLSSGVFGLLGQGLAQSILRSSGVCFTMVTSRDQRMVYMASVEIIHLNINALKLSNCLVSWVISCDFICSGH